MTADYNIKLQDNAGRTAELFITGACIDELIASGASESEARESVESNAFWNAIDAGEIGEDAWIV